MPADRRAIRPNKPKRRPAWQGVWAAPDPEEYPMTHSANATIDLPPGAVELAGQFNPRAAYIKGLRALAAALEAHPELELPFTGRVGAMTVIPSREAQREQLAAWAKVLPGKKDKAPRDEYFDLEGAFYGLHVKVICNRDEVCERVVTGTREVTEEVPDPESLAAVPKVTVTKTVEDVEWRCHPILAEDGGAA